MRAKWIIFGILGIFALVAWFAIRGWGDGRLVVIGPEGTALTVRLDGGRPAKVRGAWSKQVGQGTHTVEIRADGEPPYRARVTIPNGGDQWVVPTGPRQCFARADVAEILYGAGGIRAHNPNVKLVTHRFPAKPFLVPPDSWLPGELPESVPAGAIRGAQVYVLGEVDCERLEGSDDEILRQLIAQVPPSAAERQAAGTVP